MASRCIAGVLLACGLLLTGCGLNPVDITDVDAPENIALYGTYGLTGILADTSGGYWGVGDDWLVRIHPDQPDGDGNIVAQSYYFGGMEGAQLFHAQDGTPSMIADDGLFRLDEHYGRVRRAGFPYGTGEYNEVYHIGSDSVCVFVNQDGARVWVWEYHGSGPYLLFDDSLRTGAPPDWLQVAAYHDTVAVAYPSDRDEITLAVYVNGERTISSRCRPVRAQTPLLPLVSTPTHFVLSARSEFSDCEELWCIPRDTGSQGEWNSSRYCMEQPSAWPTTLAYRTPNEAWIRSESGYAVISSNADSALPSPQHTWYPWRSAWYNRFDVFTFGEDGKVIFYDEATQRFAVLEQ